MKEVSVLRCNEYDYATLRETLVNSIKNLGGLEKYIQKGDKVLLKVNMLMRRKPDEATTTHPVFVEALASILIEYGASVVIGDSPGGVFNEALLRSAYRVCGFQEAANASGATLNFNVGHARRTYPEGRYIKNLVVTDMLGDVDKVISVAKLKTHGMTTFTGAVKNMFGCIPGTLKAEYHLNMPTITEFSGSLVDICGYVNPVLSFMDGIIGMEGDGPSGGTPKHVGAVLASASPYHLDNVATYMIGLDPKAVPTVNECIKRGIIKGDFSDIRLQGDDLESFVVSFKIPHTRYINPSGMRLPKAVEKFVNVHVKPRPVFLHDKCVGCKICADNCPPKIIKMKEGKPYVNLSKCIRCFCCQELCPKKAVTVYSPLINKVVFKK